MKPQIYSPTQSTPDRIIEAARQLMTERGLLEVSVADISARAGTNVALVNYHFGTREGLMLAIADMDGARAAGHLKKLLAADMAPTAKIETHIKGLIEAYYERPYLHRLLQKLLREGSPQASARIGALFVEPVAAARSAIIGDGIARGEFREVDARLISFAIDGACSHIFSSKQARQTILGDGTLTRPLVERYVQEVSQLIIGGLLKR
jgi:AcrR family transcriptional regulator